MAEIQGRPVWAVIAAAIVIPAVTMGFSLVSFPLWVVPWTEEFGLARGPVMIALALAGLAMSLSAPVAGWLIAKFSARSVVVGGAAAMAVGFLLAANATAFWQVVVLFATLIGLGVGFSGLLPAQTVAIQCAPDRAGAMTGLIILGLSLGSALMPVAIAPALIAFGWRATFVFAAAALAVIIMPLAWLLLVAPKAAAAAPSAVGAPATTGAGALKTWAFWIIIIGVVPIMAALGAVQANIVAIASDVGMRIETASYLVSIIAVGSALGGVAIGWLADRIDPRLAYTLVAAAIATSVLALIGQSSFYIYAAALALFGLACGGAIPLLGVLIVKHFGAAEFPRVSGLLAPFFIPAVFAPVAAGWARDVTGGYDLVFVLVAALFLPGIFAIWRLVAEQPALAPAQNPAAAG